MTRRLALLAAVFVVTLAIGQVAYAEDDLSADIPFAFIVSGHTYSPGKYEIRIADDQIAVSLVPAKGPALPLLAQTRLAQTDPAGDARIVFDKVGDKYFLSEAWFPGSDGYLLHATKEAHTHHSIKLLRRPKKS